MRLPKVFLVFTLLLLLSGCGNNGGVDDVAGQVATLMAQANLATMQATSAPVQPTNTPLPISTVQQTSAPYSPASITITAIQETAPGRVIISWDAIGDFPYGYNVVWTTEQRNPTFPEDTYSFTGDPNARSAMISGTIGQIYLVRVCRVMNGVCDVYSDLGIFAFTSKAPTLAQQATVAFTIAPPPPGGGGGSGGATLTPAVELKITGVSGGGDGKARMTWTSTLTPNKGFAILYSTSDKEPVWGNNAYFIVNDGAAREAYLDGKSGRTYYYRICSLKNGVCDQYSAAVTFTFPNYN